MRLTTKVHDRDSAGLRYVYPVVSRRAGGVSVGINLNTNNACNWRCVYCQVPGLVQGKAPEVDLATLERELDEMLRALVEGDFLERHVPEGSRRINDVALSGNGEPTSSPRFREAVEIAIAALRRFHLEDEVKLVLITNGSLVHKASVQSGLAAMATVRGEVWFKLDSATAEGQARTNDNRAGVERALSNLRTAASLCPTWIQTCVFARNGEAPDEREQEAYLSSIGELVAEGTPLQGVLLYGLARRSHQPEAAELEALPAEWLDDFARRIEARGLRVRVSL